MRNWELQVQFRVSGSTKDLYGDGFAIWYTRDRMQPGEVFGSKDYFSGLAIVADTYSNHNGPHNVSYGNTGCGVFKRGGTKLERFLPIRINIPKGNY